MPYESRRTQVLKYSVSKQGERKKGKTSGFMFNRWSVEIDVPSFFVHHFVSIHMHRNVLLTLVLWLFYFTTSSKTVYCLFTFRTWGTTHKTCGFKFNRWLVEIYLPSFFVYHFVSIHEFIQLQGCFTNLFCGSFTLLLKY